MQQRRRRQAEAGDPPGEPLCRLTTQGSPHRGHE